MSPTPPTPPPLPPQNLLQQQQTVRGGQRTPTPNTDYVPMTKSLLRELYSQDEQISIYSRL